MAPKALDTVVLKGTGSKTGDPVILAGDYVLMDSVQTKAGCHWQLFIDGWDAEPIDEVTSDSPGDSSLTTDEQGLDLRPYTLRVVATKCGAWSVSLARP